MKSKLLPMLVSMVIFVGLSGIPAIGPAHSREFRPAQKTGRPSRESQPDEPVGKTKSDVVAAPAPRFVPEFPRRKVQSHQSGFISYVGSFKVDGLTAEGLYRWRETINPPRYLLWEGRFHSVGTYMIRYGGRGGVTGFPRDYLALVYKDNQYNFWLAFSAQQNPDGTYNLAFSENFNDPNGWYWWDDNMRRFDVAN